MLCSGRKKHTELHHLNTVILLDIMEDTFEEHIVNIIIVLNCIM